MFLGGKKTNDSTWIFSHPNVYSLGSTLVEYHLWARTMAFTGERINKGQSAFPENSQSEVSSGSGGKMATAPTRAMSWGWDSAEEKKPMIEEIKGSFHKVLTMMGLSHDIWQAFQDIIGLFPPTYSSVWWKRLTRRERIPHLRDETDCRDHRCQWQPTRESIAL